MDKIGSASTFQSIPGAQIPDTQAQKQSEPLAQIAETNTSTTQSHKQESATRKQESDLQASVRKEDLLAQVDKGKVKTDSVNASNQIPKTLKSEAELRDLYAKKAFPAVKEGFEKAGFSVNKETCNIAAGMMKNALEKQGVDGVSIRESGQHTFLEVKTKEGKKIIIDPTASQFFKDGTSVDSKLQKEGFIGTEKELKKLISDNLESWRFVPSWGQPNAEALAVVRGKNNPDIPRKDAEQNIGTYQQEAERTYFSGVQGVLGSEARKQAEWYDRGKLDEPFINLFKTNMGPSLKTAYEAMEQKLQE
jgi:hypothetical protein